MINEVIRNNHQEITDLKCNTDAPLCLPPCYKDVNGTVASLKSMPYTQCSI